MPKGNRYTAILSLPSLPKLHKNPGVYCRVSSNNHEQLSSLAQQVSHYVQMFIPPCHYLLYDIYIDVSSIHIKMYKKNNLAFLPPVYELLKPINRVSLFFLSLIRFPVLVISQVEHQIAQPLLEFRVVDILLEQFHVVSHDGEDDLLQHTVAFGTGFLLVAVAHSVLVLLVSAYHAGNLHNLATDVIGIVPVDIAEHMCQPQSVYQKAKYPLSLSESNNPLCAASSALKNSLF